MSDGKYRLQFCHDGVDITSQFHAESDASEVRVWDENELVTVAVAERAGKWQFQFSDYVVDLEWDIYRWFGSWREALDADRA